MDGVDGADGGRGVGAAMIFSDLRGQGDETAQVRKAGARWLAKQPERELGVGSAKQQRGCLEQ